MTLGLLTTDWGDGEAPPMLREAVERATGDLLHCAPLPLRLHGRRDPGDADVWVIEAHVGATVTGFWLTTNCGPAALVSDVADRLQEVFIEEERRAVPKCSLHEHPLSAIDVDGEARWQCMSDPAAWSCTIGELAERLDS